MNEPTVIIDFSMVFFWLCVLLVTLALLPWISYGIRLLGRAWYAGRMDAIQSSFQSKSRELKECEKREKVSSTKSDPKMM
jgi:hypothetical protein